MNEQKTNKFFNYGLIGIGVLCIIFSILCFVLNLETFTGVTISAEKYGGDAYTGIQNAGAATANNVYWLTDCVVLLSKTVRMGFGFTLLVTGLLVILFGVKKVCAEKVNIPTAAVNSIDAN